MLLLKEILSRKYRRPALAVIVLRLDREIHFYVVVPRRDREIHFYTGFIGFSGLLRFARNDGVVIVLRLDREIYFYKCVYLTYCFCKSFHTIVLFNQRTHYQSNNNLSLLLYSDT